MSIFKIADAQKNLPELVDRALKGEDIVISLRDAALVEIRPVVKPATTVPRPITQADIDWLDQHRVGRLSTAEDAGTYVSRMRDEDDERLSRR
jgi:antitoxin (DNA-binding transcriptional repressor) of toxin-antitoxin stability system